MLIFFVRLCALCEHMGLQVCGSKSGFSRAIFTLMHWSLCAPPDKLCHQTRQFNKCKHHNKHRDPNKS